MRGGKGLLSSLIACRSGAAAVEFAFVAWPFFLLLFGILEIGVLTFQSAAMDGATRAAARQLRTGQVQSSANALATFQTAFCNNLVGASCANFYFDVRSFGDFTQIALPTITFDSSGKPSNASFAPGGSGSVMTVRVYYNYPFMTPIIGNLMGGTSNTVLLVSTAVFQAEPFVP